MRRGSAGSPRVCRRGALKPKSDVVCAWERRACAPDVRAGVSTDVKEASLRHCVIASLRHCVIACRELDTRQTHAGPARAGETDTDTDTDTDTATHAWRARGTNTKCGVL
jgi:hypothetical protein